MRSATGQRVYILGAGGSGKTRSGYYVKAAREPEAVDDWDALSRALTLERLAPHTHKVVHLRRPREVRALLRQLRKPDTYRDPPPAS